MQRRRLCWWSYFGVVAVDLANINWFTQHTVIKLLQKQFTLINRTFIFSWWNIYLIYEKYECFLHIHTTAWVYILYVFPRTDMHAFDTSKTISVIFVVVNYRLYKVPDNIVSCGHLHYSYSLVLIVQTFVYILLVSCCVLVYDWLIGL